MRLLYVLLLCPITVLAQPGASGRSDKAPRQATVLYDTTRFIPVGQQLAVLEDKTGRLTLAEVRQRQDFRRSTSENFQYGFSNSAYWFRFDLLNRNRENTKHWLVGLLDAATLDYVDLYLVYPNGQVRHQAGGLKRPYVDQGFFATTPFFRVELPPNTPVTVYFRIRSSLAMFGKVTVWDEYYNLSKGRVIIFAIWMFLGLFILRSLNNFVLARFIPDPQFRFYAVCTFLLYLSTLSRTGIYPIILSGHPVLLEWMHYGMGRLMPLGLAAWMYSLLDDRRVFRPLRWLLLGVIGVCAVGVILPFFVQNASLSRFNAVIVAMMYGLFFLNVFLIWFSKSRSAVHFVLPIALCTVPFFLFQLQSLSVIPYRPVISQLALLALAVEMVSMSLVLGRVVRSYIKERIATADALIREKVEVDKLQELDAVKTQFFTNISHEFRTPLTLLLGPLADLKRRFPAEPLLPLMERNTNRLLGLINQLLDLSKLEAGQLKAQPEPGDLATFFRTQASSFESLAESQRIRFLFSQNQDECWAEFDRGKLETIVNNLLANAFKFTPAGNDVRMSVHYGPGQFTCVVEDTGIGIPPTHLARIFERFYQVDGKINRPYEGTGIGLALVHELTNVLGGRIEVSSIEKAGTTFHITMPLVPTVPFDQPAAEYPHPAGHPKANAKERSEPLDAYGQPRTPAGFEIPIRANHSIPSAAARENVLLIIDDNADIRAYVRSIFEGDYQILEAVDGQDGLEQATATLPDVVICDLMMHRLDGFGFCRALKSQAATSHIPVVMLTAKATPEDRLEGFELGADDYLTKPFNRDELTARVRNLIQQRQRLFQYFAEQAQASASDQPPVLPAKPALLATEQQFLERLTAVIVQHLDDLDFTVELLADAVNMSRVQLHRKLKALTNTTASLFIRDIRLAKAAEMLNEGSQSVTQIAFAVGFDNLSYFAKVFQERYGSLPSQYGKATSSVK
ncbi:response regulator [Fibrisoma montanum]|uniref:histidine kinase n=1 Tax=Fibrisoma montanum TaxID=2305895 RepID=A0A418MCK7_9BACT|nr:7TM-DISM domain-containing protein [Fibrisoma montanum]RIV24113.1 response regulator [Fibrisoma montanum]